MSISGASSVSLNQQVQSYFQTRNSDVKQLGQALKSGNLAAAQVAYNNITALGQGGPFGSGKAFGIAARAGLQRHRSGSASRQPGWGAAGVCGVESHRKSA